jgi:transitional endoplasmic reticulum ATPase
MALKLRKKTRKDRKHRPRKQLVDLTFQNIGGYDAVKQEIRDAIIMPMRHPQLYKRLNIRAPKGILLWGAPGTGKTLFARTIARECSATFYHIRSSDIMSEWFGVSERRVRQLFLKAAKTRPSIVFFDELESLAPNRQAITIEDARTSLLSSLLSEMDGFVPLNRVTILGSTNIPNRLDPALLRPGRFDKMIYIPPPNKVERKEILKIHLDGKPIDEIDVDILAQKTNLFTGADLELLVNNATTNWLKKFIANKKEPLSMSYFENALGTVRPSLRGEDLRYYEYLRNYFERSSSSTNMKSESSPTYYG